MPCLLTVSHRVEYVISVRQFHTCEHMNKSSVFVRTVDCGKEWGGFHVYVSPSLSSIRQNFVEDFRLFEVLACLFWQCQSTRLADSLAASICKPTCSAGGVVQCRSTRELATNYSPNPRRSKLRPALRRALKTHCRTIYVYIYTLMHKATKFAQFVH